MPTASVSIEIHAPREAVFDLIHDYAKRLQWDPFLREAALLNGATAANLGVSTRCAARRRIGGFSMETVYVSFHRPRVAAVKMTRGPSFLESFAATLRQDAMPGGSTRVMYRYHFTSRPRWLAPLLNLIVRRAFDAQTRRRLAALKQFLETTSQRRGGPADSPPLALAKTASRCPQDPSQH